MKTCELQKPILIPGPCAAESREQVLLTAKMALDRKIEAIRVSLTKPRTRPSWKGVGREGIPWLVEVAEMGIMPGTEVMLPQEAEDIMNAMEQVRGRKRLYLWLGARDQNDKIQELVGSLIKGVDWVILGIKNQPWRDEDHWEGIIEHVLSGGADKSQLVLCHRGFAPGSNGYRNNPDFSMAMRIKEKSGRLPMLLDPSHIGGDVTNVLEVTKEAMRYKHPVNGLGFDGLQIEVHPDPINAETDKKQQLTWRQFDSLIEDLGIKKLALVS